MAVISGGVAGMLAQGARDALPVQFRRDKQMMHVVPCRQLT